MAASTPSADSHLAADTSSDNTTVALMPYSAGVIGSSDIAVTATPMQTSMASSSLSADSHHAADISSNLNFDVDCVTITSSESADELAQETTDEFAKKITGERIHMMPESSVDSHHAEKTALYIINWSEETWEEMNRRCTGGDQFDLLHNYRISMRLLQKNQSHKAYKEELQIWQTTAFATLP